MTQTLDLQPSSRGLYMTSRTPARLGLATLAGFVVIFGVWGSTAPLSSAAIAQGSLQVEGQRQAVQHPYGGVVRDLSVRDGDRVEKGQVLLTLSPTEPRAEVDVLASERDALWAEEARLVAERDRHDVPDFAKLDARRDLASVAQFMANERAILAARRRQTTTQIEILQQRVAQLKEQKSGLEAQIAGLDRQRALLEEEASGARQLLASGYTPKTRVLGLERTAAGLEADRGARLAEAARAQEAIGEAELEIARIDRNLTTEVTDRLREVQSRLAGLTPKIAAAQDRLDRTEIRAPAAGFVVGLNVFTEGGVVQPGAKLLEIVPAANPLLVEARLPITDVSEVAIGSIADVRLTSVNRNERPTIRGEVVVVSADRLTDDRTGQGYYAVKVRMNPEDVAKAGMPLQAGMAAEVVVPTKGRTLVQYLVGPLLDELSGAFREK